MSEAADREANERSAIRGGLPTALVSEFRIAAYPDVAPEDGYLLAGIHLTQLVVDHLIERDGSLTPHGEETLRNLSAIATWNRRRPAATVPGA